MALYAARCTFLPLAGTALFAFVPSLPLHSYPYAYSTRVHVLNVDAYGSSRTNDRRNLIRKTVDAPLGGRRATRRGRSTLSSAPQGGDDREEDLNANLFRVTPVPTYEEMLAWAEETDARIGSGELPPLGLGQVSSTAGGEMDSLLSNQEKAQIKRVSELVSKRRRQGDPLSEADAAALRRAMEAVTALVGEEDSGGVSRSSTTSDIASTTRQAEEESLSKAGTNDVVVGGGAGGENTADGKTDGGTTPGYVHNPIYGSREVRDKVYLYAWSLLKRQQEEEGFEQSHDCQ